MKGARATLTWLAAALSGAAAPGQDDPASHYYLYAAAESADQVYLVRFDGTRAEAVEVIDVGYQPTEIEGPHGLTVSPDGRFWFVTMAHGNPWGVLYKYSTAGNKKVGQCELGLFPATMQISLATGLLYCVNFDLHGDGRPSSVSVVDPDAVVEVARTTTGSMPHGSRLGPDGRFHYSCAMMSGELYEIDALTFEVSRVLDLDAKGHYSAELMVSQMFESDELAFEVLKLLEEELESDRLEAERTGELHSTTKPTWVQPHPSQPKLFVALNLAQQVVEVDLERWEVSRRFLTGKGPYNLDVTSDGRQMVVTYKSAAAIGVWDVETGRELAYLPATRKVTHGVTIAPDGRYAFVTNEGVGAEAGTVDVIDLRSLQRVATAELGLQMGGIAFWKKEPAPREN